MRYLCPRCDSNLIGFIIDNFQELDLAMSMIRAKKVRLSDLYEDYLRNTKDPKWICYECYDCGVVLKKSSVFMPEMNNS